MSIIRPIDRDELRARVRSARPVPHFCIDNFLEEGFAQEAERSFPSFEEASRLGKEFSAVNEKKKIQITDSTKFPAPILRLHEALAEQPWLDTLSHVMDMPNLLADPQLAGGGIHETGPRGHLDVHVDFNYIPDRQLHRRLNILVYFNPGWRPEWGGNIELWDKDVKVCEHSFSPVFNRCVVFETNDVSFHGVTAVTCPADRARKSFAAYYYTKEAPKHWTGVSHDTIFRARPDEKVKGMVLMPMEKAKRAAAGVLYRIKDKIRGR
ncbi:MAG: 2OG-Fe(II) oxygenase [Phycisphaerales bacterium]